MRVCGRRGHIVSPQERGRQGDGTFIESKALPDVVRLPTHSQTGFFVLRHAPGHRISEASHPVLLDIVATEIHKGEIHEAADGDIGGLVDLALAAVDSQLPRYRSVEPAIRNPGVRTGKRATELRVSQSFCKRDEDRHILRPASGHHCIYSHVPDCRITVRHR